MVVMPPLLDMEVRQVDMEGMYPPLGMVGMRHLVDMGLGRRGMIIGDRRQALGGQAVTRRYEPIGGGLGGGDNSSFHRDTIMHQFTAK